MLGQSRNCEKRCAVSQGGLWQEMSAFERETQETKSLPPYQSCKTRFRQCIGRKPAQKSLELTVRIYRGAKRALCEGGGDWEGKNGDQIRSHTSLLFVFASLGKSAKKNTRMRLKLSRAAEAILKTVMVRDECVWGRKIDKEVEAVGARGGWAFLFLFLFLVWPRGAEIQADATSRLAKDTAERKGYGYEKKWHRNSDWDHRELAARCLCNTLVRFRSAPKKGIKKVRIELELSGQTLGNTERRRERNGGCIREGNDFGDK